MGAHTFSSKQSRTDHNEHLRHDIGNEPITRDLWFSTEIICKADILVDRDVAESVASDLAKGCKQKGDHVGRFSTYSLEDVQPKGKPKENGER